MMLSPPMRSHSAEWTCRTLSSEVTVAVLQVTVAIAVPRAASICAALGLQPRVRVVPLAVMAGPVVFTVQLTVREAVAELLVIS